MELALKLLETLPFVKDDRVRLHNTLRAAPCQHGLRATYVEPLHRLMAERGGADLVAYEALRGRFAPVPPYSFVPLSQLVLLLARASSLLFPTLPLEAATNRAFEAYVSGMRHHPNTQQVIIASGGSFFRYLQVVSESSQLWYNFGARHIEQQSTTQMRLIYEDYDVGLARFWVPGLNRGLLGMFEERGTLLFEEKGPHRFDLYIELVV